MRVEYAFQWEGESARNTYWKFLWVHVAWCCRIWGGRSEPACAMPSPRCRSIIQSLQRPQKISHETLRKLLTSTHNKGEWLLHKPLKHYHKHFFIHICPGRGPQQCLITQTNRKYLWHSLTSAQHCWFCSYPHLIRHMWGGILQTAPGGPRGWRQQDDGDDYDVFLLSDWHRR